MSQKIGAVQLQDIQGDIAASLRVIKQALKEADRNQVDILCFAECFLQGYTLDKNETNKRAINLKSQQFKDIIAELASHKATAIIGIIEEFENNFYNTAAIIKRGKLIGKYQKIHLFEQNFTPGSANPIFSSNDLKFGINICYDARFSDGAMALTQNGARVIFYPLNNRLPEEKAVKYREKHLPNLIERAKETGCWIVSSDVIDNSNGHIGYGCTAIVDPTGNVHSQVTQLKIGTIMAEIPSRMQL